MQLADLRTFLVVIQERSFTRAAERLGRSQPAISLTIRRLEEESGGALLAHTRNKRVELTPAGELLLGYAERLTALTAEMRGALGDFKNGGTAVVIGANDSLAGILLPFVDAFQRAHPHIRVDIRHARSRSVAAQVQRKLLDFGVTTAEPTLPGLDTLVFATDELVVLVAPSHPLARKSRADLSEVASERVIAHNQPSSARARTLDLFEQGGSG